MFYRFPGIRIPTIKGYHRMGSQSGYTRNSARWKPLVTIPVIQWIHLVSYIIAMVAKDNINPPITIQIDLGNHTGGTSWKLYRIIEVQRLTIAIK